MRRNLHQNPSYRKFPNAQESSPHHYRMKVHQFPCVGIFTRPHYTTPLPNEGTDFHAQESSPHHYPLPNEGIQKNRSVIFIKILYGKGSKRGGLIQICTSINLVQIFVVGKPPTDCPLSKLISQREKNKPGEKRPRELENFPTLKIHNNDKKRVEKPKFPYPPK